MPLELYRRGDIWWFRGKIDRLPGSRYYRQSTGTSEEGAAREIVAEFEKRQLKGHYAGHRQALTFAEAILLYDATPQMARFIEIIIKRDPNFAERACAEITGQEVKALAPRIYPDASTDTWQRQVCTPISAVINNAHELGNCPPIRIKAFSARERIAQDARRGKQSRVKKTPGNWAWLEAFRVAARELGEDGLATMALFMFLKGRRISTMIQLEPKHMDLQNHRVWLTASKGWDAGWVDIPVELVVELANLEPRRPRMHRARDGSRRRWPVRVFGFARRDAVYPRWRAICKHAAIEVILPHAAGRHGFGTETISRLGIDPASAAREGGWANPGQMFRTYAHPVEDTSEIQAKIRANRPDAKDMKKAQGDTGG